MNRRKTHCEAFSLIEAIVALVMAVMVIVAVFAIYDRARCASDSITQKLDEYVLPSEILQKIAEDIDRIAGPGADVKITIGNSFQSGLPAAQLIISSQTTDKDGQPQILEKVAWQTDYDRPTGRLILYRSHSGEIWEDNLLDEDQRENWTPDRQLFVPLCTGISYFKVQVPQPLNLAPNGSDTDQPASARSLRNQNSYQNDQQFEEQKFYDVWNQAKLPPAIVVTISFANPIEGRGVGGAEVLDEQKIKRTIVLDRSKKMNFVYVPLANRDANFPQDPNVRASDNRNQDTLVPNNSRDDRQPTGGNRPRRSTRPGDRRQR